jgi:hypothetical protein
MTSRDTHDIVEYARETSGRNIQPEMLVKLMAQSEPCLFSNQVRNLATIELRLRAAAQWHADLQVEFWRELSAD